MKRLASTLILLLAVIGCGTISKTPASSTVGLNLDNLAPALDESILVQKQEMLNLLLKYLSVESGSAGMDGYPMTDGQRQMAALLRADAEALGATATLTEWGYVYVDVPSNIEADVPVVGVSCHLDYTPEAPGKGIKPSVLVYDGGDIRLVDGSVISPSNPDGADLPELTGKTLVVSDGTTLLGADDKNGCSISMSVLRTLLNPAFKHGRVQFVWAPNEDIGMAAEKIDTSLFNPDILFDVDGMGGHEVITSNFTARGMEVKFIGHYAHASEAKKQKYGDALAALSTYIANVPLKYRPENTEGSQGYIHHFQQKNEGIDYVVSSRIRYFDENEGETFDRIINESLDKVRKEFPNVRTEVIWDERQYDNVAYSMYPGSQEIIARAAARSHQTIEFKAERAGTTAAMFVTKGLKGGLCLFSGQHNCHSVHEYACLEEMMDAYTLLLYAIDEVASGKFTRNPRQQ